MSDDLVKHEVVKGKDYYFSPFLYWDGIQNTSSLLTQEGQDKERGKGYLSINKSKYARFV